MFKGLGNLTNMIQQAREMQERMAQAKEKIAELQVEGSAGGDMVRVRASGDMRILSVQLDPSLLETGDREMLEDLVMAAMNQALEKAKTASAAQLSEVASGMNVPGLQEALSRLGLG